MPYNLHVLDLGKNEQKSPEFLKISPNGKIPAIVDLDNDNLCVFESGAILLYLAEKVQKLLPQVLNKRSEVIQWLMLQVGGVGPMMGQANVWYRYMDSQNDAAIHRYQTEVKRLFAVLDARLNQRDFLVDEFSIADIAHWAWVRTHFWSGVEIDDLPHLSAWVNRLAQRPGCQRGINKPPINIDDKSAQDEFIKNAQSMVVK